MKEVVDPLDADSRFFAALVGRDVTTLSKLLAQDFVLIDVLTGSEIPKKDLLTAIDSGQLVFERIQPSESRVRYFGQTALVIGRTEMAGRYAGNPFGARSRYTHVFFKDQEEWHLVSAQGTKLAD